MPDKFLSRNNVKTTLADDITPSTTQFRIFNASPPFRSPPSPSASAKVRLTIVDAAQPTKIEIIEAETIVTDGSDHRLVTVTGNDVSLGRGLELTTVESFSPGAIVYMANTAEMIDSKADIQDVITVSREIITKGGDNYMKVTTSENNSENIVLFTYKL